MRHCKWN